MNNSIGFPNLDLYSEHESGGGESFWPSFTDIMMVIVMVFLLITVTVIMNNWQLMENLRLSVNAEKLASHQAQTALSAAEVKKKENESLGERLARMESLLADRTSVLQQVRSENETVNQALEESQQQLTDTESTLSNLQTEKESLQSLNTSAEDKLAQLNEALVTKTQQAEELSEQVEVKQQALDKAETEANNSREEVDALREKSQEGYEQLASLQGEYDSLDTKYQKLLQPARSGKNKHIVKVIYTKKKGVSAYQLQKKEGGKYKTLSRSGLNKQLSALKKKYGTDLYVKIIIPDDSGLSHTEAWKFTSTILKTYDYYYTK